MNTLAVEGKLRPVNPATLEPVGVVPVTEDVAYVVAGAAAAQPSWGSSSFDERRALLERVAEVLVARMDEIAATVTAESLSELMVIRRQEFFEILRKEHQLAVKLLWQFTGVLADRLAETTRELGAAKEELAAEDITGEIFAEDEDDDRKTLVIPPPPPSRRPE